MKTHNDPSRIPQTEGHPEAFPDVTTMPKGWDLSEMATERSLPVEAIEEIINFDMDARMAFEDDMA